jgi:hypothetical protein
MAILSGGLRIGNFDVRVGINRDRSLDNVNQDPRFRQGQGGNPQTVIGRIQSYINEAEGFARKARYYVEFNLPKGNSSGILGNLQGIDDVSQVGITSSTSESAQTFRSGSVLNNIQKSEAKRVQAFCSAIQMPERDIQVKEVRHHGPMYKIAHDYKSADITATFYCDKFMRERSYFELWQASIYSNQSNNYNFYDNYISDVNIYQLGSFLEDDSRDEITYGVQLYECFPKIIGPVEYSYEANAVQTFNVTFTFRYWINYYLDKAGEFNIGTPTQKNVVVKPGGGLFGGLLDNLPPTLRRAATGVLEQAQRSLPIGKITGGRVSPPFTNLPGIPPFNL